MSAIAFYLTAKPERRKETKTLLIPVGLTAMLCGITEPLDFTFLFIAPQLFVVHSILGADALHGAEPRRHRGHLRRWHHLHGFLGLPAARRYLRSAVPALHRHRPCLQRPSGSCLPLPHPEFDFKTPGREDDDVEVSLKSKADYKAAQGGAAASKEVAGSKAEERAIFAQNILDLLGGTENVVGRHQLRHASARDVKDETLVADDANFRAIGAHGIAKNGKNMQVIIGLSVPKVRDALSSCSSKSPAGASGASPGLS